MGRGRQLPRTLNLAQNGKTTTTKAESPTPGNRAFRRLGLFAALAVAALVGAQIVFAVPPTNVSFTPPATVTRGESVTFEAAEAADPDGGTITSYDWNFGDGTTGSGRIVSHVYPNSTPAGQKTVTLTVTDSNNETASVSHTLEVVNLPPTAAVSCSPATVAVNAATNCNSNGSSDPEGSLTYAWDSDGDGFDDGTDPSEQFSFATSGPKTITLQVTDSDNAKATAQQQITVGNPGPTARATFSPPNPNVNDPVDFDGSGSSDPEGESLTYAWDMDNDGQFDDGSGPTVLDHRFPTAGNKTVRLRVTDPQQNSDVAVLNVPVTSRAPTASFAFSGTNPVTPNVPDVGETINFTSTSTDPDGAGDIARLDWDLDGDGQFNDRSGAAIQHSFGTPGNKTIGVRVTDNSGATHSTTRTVRVNALPVANANSLNPQGESGQRYNVPLVGQPILFTGEPTPALPAASPAPGCPALPGSPASPGSSDAEGPIADANYRWDLDNDGQFDDATGVDAPFAGFPTPGQKTVRLQVTDSDGAMDDASLQVRVNRAPTPDFVFEPSFPIIGQEITFGSTSGDPDSEDDAGQLTYSWDLDGDGTFCETSPNETGASVKHTFTVAGTYPIELRITDTGGITRPATRDVLVQNTIPTGGISFSPDAPLPGEPVHFTGSASSPTGKAIASMQWDFNFDQSGQFDVEAEGASVSRAFSSPGLKRVGLRIQEIGGGFAIVPATVNVNAPPQARFSVAPESAFVGDTVTLSSTSVDPDGPLASQEWDLDNDGQFDDANAQVVSARFHSAGTHPLKLRVTDSRGATSTATGQVIVSVRPVPPPPPTPLLTGVVISGRFLLFRRDTKIRFLRVRAPAGSMIRIRCSGKKCPKQLTKKQLGKRLKKAQRVQFKALQRRFRPGAKLIVTVTKSGFIGRQTTFTLRRRKAPLRRDLCLPPGAKKATTCPSG
jgi:PKD repeat protein